MRRLLMISFTFLVFVPLASAGSGYFLRSDQSRLSAVFVDQAKNGQGRMNILNVKPMNPGDPDWFCREQTTDITPIKSFPSSQIQVDPALTRNTLDARGCGILIVTPNEDDRVHAVDCHVGIDVQGRLRYRPRQVFKNLPVRALGKAPFPAGVAVQTYKGSIYTDGKRTDTYTCQLALTKDAILIKGIRIPGPYNEWICDGTEAIGRLLHCDSTTYLDPRPPGTDFEQI